MQQLRLFFPMALLYINPTRCNNCVYSSQWLYSTLRIYFTIKHDARNHKY